MVRIKTTTTTESISAHNEQPQGQSHGSSSTPLPCGPRFLALKSRPPLLPQQFVQTPRNVGVFLPQ